MLIMICFGWFEYFWVYWNYDDVLKYEYDMLDCLCFIKKVGVKDMIMKLNV